MLLYKRILPERKVSHVCVCAPLQVQRKYEAADSRAATAAKRVTDLTSKLSSAEDTIVALEGHISVLVEELGRYTLLPQ